jgi:hypothetical protein
MIELIPKLPSYVVGFVASGQVTANDYETVLIPAVLACLKQQQKVCVLCHLGPAFSSFSAGAILDDAKLGLGHLHAWEKIAIVTDKKWIKSAADIFKYAIPCPLKVFANTQYAEAQSWIVN